MDVFAQLAEAKIVDAMERGEFDDLPGRGKPLALDDLSRVPSEMRMAYTVLRNAGVAPPEVELRREIYSLDRLIAGSDDASELADLRRRKREADLHYSVLMERRRRRASITRTLGHRR